MSKILISLLTLVSINAFAVEEINYTVPCHDTREVYNELTSEYNETIVLGGKSQIGIMTLWVNTDTRTWTIMITNKEKTCVISAGDNLSIKGESGKSL
jgi:hypothetical protein